MACNPSSMAASSPCHPVLACIHRYLHNVAEPLTVSSGELHCYVRRCELSASCRCGWLQPSAVPLLGALGTHCRGHTIVGPHYSCSSGCGSRHKVNLSGHSSACSLGCAGAAVLCVIGSWWLLLHPAHPAAWAAAACAWALGLAAYLHELLDWLHICI